MLLKRTAVVVTAAGLSALVVVGCGSSTSGVSPIPSVTPGMGQPGAVTGVGLPPPQVSVPGVSPIPGVAPIPGVPVAPPGVVSVGDPIPGVPAAPPTADAKPVVPIPGVQPQPLPPELRRPDKDLTVPTDVTVPNDLTVPAVPAS